MAEAADAVRVEMAAAMKVACAEGIIVAMPALPGPPPCRDASPEELTRFEDGALQLASIAALAGVPQVLAAQQSISSRLMLACASSQRVHCAWLACNWICMLPCWCTDGLRRHATGTIPAQGRKSGQASQ